MKMKLERLNQNGRRGLELLSLIMEANLCVLPDMLHSIITKPASNLNRHYEEKHKNFATNYSHTSRTCMNNLTALKSSVTLQQTLSKTCSKEADTTAEANFVTSWNIARSKYPYSDGEFVKKNISEIIAVLDINNTELQRLISQTPVSRHTVERRVSCINADFENKLQNDFKNSTALSLALQQISQLICKTNCNWLHLFVM